MHLAGAEARATITSFRSPESHSGQTGGGRCGRTRGWALGAAACALPLVAILVGLARGGWRPTGDEAVIAWRSWDVLAGQHGALVGQFTTGGSFSTGQPVYDPGPLLFWLLALPTHLAPGIGPVVGMTVISVLSLACACAAAVSVAGSWAGTVVAAGILLLEWTLAGQLAGAPVWNPYAGLIPLASMLVVAWAVAAGRLAWLGVLVFLASFCIQDHLMYAPTAGLVVLAAPVVGLLVNRARRPIPWRALAGGVAVAALSWAGPLWQQLHDQPGNLGLLWRVAKDGSTSTLGWGFAFRQLARGVAPTGPVWLQPPHRRTVADLAVPGGLTLLASSLVVLALVAIGIAGWRAARADVAALAVTALVANVGVAYFIAHTPAGQLSFTLLYTENLLEPVGLFTWFALGYGIFAAFRWRQGRAGPAHDRPGEVPGPRGRRPAGKFWLVSFFALAGMSLASISLSIWLVVVAPSYELRNGARQGQLAAASRVAALAPAAHPRDGRLTIEVPIRPGMGALEDVSYQMAIAYRLRTQGWAPTLGEGICQQIQRFYCALADDPQLGVGESVPAGAQPSGHVVVPTPDGPALRQVWWRPPGGR